MTKKLSFTEVVNKTVTIMSPLPSVYARGPASTKKQQPTRSIRMDQHELDAIDQAAELLQMSRSAFMRWCSYRVSLDIIEQHKEYMKQSK